LDKSLYFYFASHFHWEKETMSILNYIGKIDRALVTFMDGLHFKGS